MTFKFEGYVVVDFFFVLSFIYFPFVDLSLRNAVATYQLRNNVQMNQQKIWIYDFHAHFLDEAIVIANTLHDSQLIQRLIVAAALHLAFCCLLSFKIIIAIWRRCSYSCTVAIINDVAAFVPHKGAHASNNATLANCCIIYLRLQLQLRFQLLKYYCCINEVDGYVAETIKIIKQQKQHAKS